MAVLRVFDSLLSLDFLTSNDFRFLQTQLSFCDFFCVLCVVFYFKAHLTTWPHKQPYAIIFLPAALDRRRRLCIRLFALAPWWTTRSVLLGLTLSIKGPEAVLDKAQVILLSGRHFCWLECSSHDLPFLKTGSAALVKHFSRNSKTNVHILWRSQESI